MKRPNARFWGNVGVVVWGAAVAQAIPVIGSLLLARLFAPAEFGQFAVWFGLVSLAAVALSGRYEMALVLESTAESRRAGAAATLVVIVVASILLAVLCTIAVLLKAERFGGLSPMMIALLTPTALLIASAQTWQSWAASEGRFADLASMRIAQAAGVTGLQILAGYVSSTATALAAAHAAGVLCGVAIAARRLPPERVPLQRLREFWRRHRDFPAWALPAGLISAGAAQLPVLIVASRFGAESAGLLALTIRTLGAPTALLGLSVLDVFKVDAARSYLDTGQCRSDYVRTLRGLSVGAVIGALPLALASEHLFAFAFGEAWRPAGIIGLWLLPMFVLRFVASPLSYMFLIAGRQRWDLAWQAALFGATLATLSLAPAFPAAMKWYGAAYGALYVVYLWMSYRLSYGVGYQRPMHYDN